MSRERSLGMVAAVALWLGLSIVPGAAQDATQLVYPPVPAGLDKSGIGVELNGLPTVTGLPQLSRTDPYGPGSVAAFRSPGGAWQAYVNNGTDWMPTQTDPTAPPYVMLPSPSAINPALIPDTQPRFVAGVDQVGLYNGYGGQVALTLTGVGPVATAPQQISLASGEVRTFQVAAGATAEAFISVAGTRLQFELANGRFYAVNAAAGSFTLDPM